MQVHSEADREAIRALVAGYLREGFCDVQVWDEWGGVVLLRAMERPKYDRLFFDPRSVMDQVIYGFVERVQPASSAGEFARNLVEACDRMKADLANKRPQRPTRGKALVVE